MVTHVIVYTTFVDNMIVSSKLSILVVVD